MLSLTLIFFLTFNGHFGANTFLELLLNMTKHDYDHTFISKNVSNIMYYTLHCHNLSCFLLDYIS